MAQKNATPNKAQQEVLKRNGLNALTWVVIKDLNHSMIVKHRFTGEVEVINKRGGINMENNDLLAAVAAYVVTEGHKQEPAKAKVKRILNGISSASPEREAKSVEVAIKRMLLELGVPTHIKGYSRLACAIRIVVDDPAVAEAITKGLYPAVAKEFGDTPSRVERAIRHAIEVGLERCDLRTIERYFGNTISSSKGKPTNSEFITRLADVVRDGV